MKQPFVFGAATSSYQIEGAFQEGGKGLNIWDIYVREKGKIYNGHTGDIACDHYHRFREDVALMKEIGLQAYRFSINWARILPDGIGAVNQEGIRFYKELIEELKKLNKKMVILLACGSAVEMPFDDKKINSILHTYLPGQAGAGAIVKILNGDVNPSGKLAETYPIKYEDVPSSFNFPCHDEFIDYKESIFVGYRYFDTKGVKVKFPFGYGLSYTTFQYDNLKISKDGIKFTIKNTGSVTGKEIAQMYVSLPGSVILRPNKELKGFTKVELKPGEEKEVTIPFDDKTFRYFNTATNKFEIEDGDYLISVGASLEDIRLQGIIHVDGTTDNLPYDKSEFPGYLALDIKAIPDQEFEKLLGRNIKPNIIKGKKHRQTVDYNTTVMELRYSRGWTGRFFAGALRFAYNFLNFFGQHSTANTLVMGVFHQPMRNLSKMGGIMSMGQLDGLIIMFNGKFFKGLNHFFKAGKVRKQEKKAAKKKAESENK